MRLVAAIILGLAATAAFADAPKRPNVLVIFTDDHARHALSCYGSQVNRTPHLDRLAVGGARFLNAFVTNSICTPSRATLLTGQYSHTNGVPVFNRFDGSRDHLAKRMQAGGYHTGVVGKWHLGSDPTGFDRWIVLPGQGDYWNPTFLVPGGSLSIEGHCTAITTDLGLEFLKTRPREQPFFLMLHHKAPHRPWQPDEANRAAFATASVPEPATLFDDYATRPAALPENRQTIAHDLTRRDLKLEPPPGLGRKERARWLNEKPESVAVDGKVLTGVDLVRWKYQRFMQDYLACVQGVDDGVGRVLDWLTAEGLDDDTIVIYTTDNGWYLGDLGLYDKRFMYEPGLRVPLLVRGPGIEAGVAPDALVANIDLAPTILDLAGLPIPDSMQGRSLAPLLRGERPADWRGSVYYRYYHDPGDHDTRAHCGVRTATHKLIHYWRKDAWELFDLVADPTEQHNLLFDAAEASSPPVATRLAELKAEMVRLQREYGDDGRYADPATRPASSVEGAFEGKRPLGPMTPVEAVAAAVATDREAAEPEARRPAAPAAPSAARGDHWPQWRGPGGDGVSAERGIPAGWSKTDHVAWRTPLPGRAGATPCVWGDRIFLTSNEGDDLVLLGLRAGDGSILWKRTVGGGNQDARAGEGNSASPSPCTDGEHVWAFFGTGILACYTIDGVEVWKTDVNDRFGRIDIQFGMTSTPVLDGDALYLQLIHGPMKLDDDTRTGKVVRLDKTTGRTVWEVDRPTAAAFECKHSYASPFLYRHEGREFLVVHGADCITGHALADGRELWRFGGLNGPTDTNPKPHDQTFRFVASPCLAPGTIIVPTCKGGPTVALRVNDELAGDRTGRASVVKWINPLTPDVSIPLVADGLVYLLHKDGKLQCVELETGKDVYLERTHTGQHRTSPLLADGRIYFGSNDGWVTVVRAGRTFEQLASVDFGGEAIAASLVAAGGTLYVRSSDALYAIRGD